MLKPPAPTGLKCPLYQKDVSKVCHTCVWYDVLHGTNAGGERVELWGCVMNRLAITMQDVGGITAQTCASMDRMRHEQTQERAQARLVMTALTAPRGSVTELPNHNTPLRLQDDRPITE